MNIEYRPLAVVTGASSGVGLELARQCAECGYDLVLAGDRPLRDALRAAHTLNVKAEALLLDMSNFSGVEVMCEALSGRRVDVLIVNSWHGPGNGFLDQDISDARHVIDAHVIGTLFLIHRLGNQMRRAGRGKILVAGSATSFMPGTSNAVYKGTRAFIDSFAMGLRDELANTGVTVTCLGPGTTNMEILKYPNHREGTAATPGNTTMNHENIPRVGFETMTNGGSEVIARMKNGADHSSAARF